jgi:hypothetical protein
LLSYSELDNPGMHTTDTIDVEVVLAGEVILELEDGVEKALRPWATVGAERYAPWLAERRIRAGYRRCLHF